MKNNGLPWRRSTRRRKMTSYLKLKGNIKKILDSWLTPTLIKSLMLFRNVVCTVVFDTDIEYNKPSDLETWTNPLEFFFFSGTRMYLSERTPRSPSALYQEIRTPPRKRVPREWRLKFPFLSFTSPLDETDTLGHGWHSTSRLFLLVNTMIDDYDQSTRDMIRGTIHEL